MTLVLETNGNGFMCWIVELPGAFIRGGSIDEVHHKFDAEIRAYSEWLNMAHPDTAARQEKQVTTRAAVEDGDTSILLETDNESYRKPEEFDHDCGLMRLSSQKVQAIYEKCRNREGIVQHKRRKTFYGDVHATIEGQYRHVVGAQQYYLENIGIRTQISGALNATRQTVVDAIRSSYFAEGNRMHKTPDEDWTLRKVIRRIIWHDRIHARAMKRMDQELCT